MVIPLYEQLDSVHPVAFSQSGVAGIIPGLSQSVNLGLAIRS
jgi:hypothetical protein